MPTDGQQVSETAKCKCGHDKEIHDWEHGCQHMAGAGPKWMCRCMDFEPAEPVAVPPAPPEIPADLKADYRDCVNWHNGSYIKGLIERIAALEGKRA